MAEMLWTFVEFGEIPSWVEWRDGRVTAEDPEIAAALVSVLSKRSVSAPPEPRSMRPSFREPVAAWATVGYVLSGLEKLGVVSDVVWPPDPAGPATHDEIVDAEDAPEPSPRSQVLRALAAATFEWDESLHERDERGRFGPGGGGGGEKGDESKGSDKEWTPGGAGTKDDPLRTSDVNEAVDALAEGKYVDLRQPDEVSVLLDKLAAISKEARELGVKAPTTDLCQVSVEGTNLFCGGSKGVPRPMMPQLAGKPEPGSWADKNMPKDAKGEVNLTNDFLKFLEGRGTTITEGDRVPADHLRPSQNQLNGVKVAGMMSAHSLPPDDPNYYDPGKAPIVTSADNYIVDGHHRWAASVGEKFTTGQPLDMNVTRVDLPIIELLAAANNYTTSRGIPKAGLRARGAALAALAAAILDG